MNYNRPCFNKNLGERAYTPTKKHKPIDIIHLGHVMNASIATGPHYAKLTCVTCNKFVKWLSQEEYTKKHS
jgi:hypothetical protein